jgi:hypothetical protein
MVEMKHTIYQLMFHIVKRNTKKYFYENYKNDFQIFKLGLLGYNFVLIDLILRSILSITYLALIIISYVN